MSILLAVFLLSLFHVSEVGVNVQGDGEQDDVTCCQMRLISPSVAFPVRKVITSCLFCFYLLL